MNDDVAETASVLTANEIHAVHMASREVGIDEVHFTARVAELSGIAYSRVRAHYARRMIERLSPGQTVGPIMRSWLGEPFITE
jgi:hypothetical protein